MPGDLPQAAPLGAQPVDQGVVALRALGELPGRLGEPGLRRLCPGIGLLPFGGLGRRSGQAAAVGGDAFLHGLGEVLPQVEPVGDLDRVRRPGARAV